MTERDMAALSPLPHSHFNPYGNFNLDMSERLEVQNRFLQYHAVRKIYT